MYQHVERHAALHPERSAVSEYLGGRQWRTTTWSTLRAMAAAVANRAHDLGAGDRAAVLVLDNSAAGVATLLGLTMASLDVMCLEPDNSHLRDLSSIRRRIGAHLVIGPDIPAISGIETTYTDLLENTSASAIGVVAQRVPEILAMTSGSTGEPRIVRQPSSGIERGGQIYRQVYGLTDDDRLFGAIPLAHSFGMMGLLAGAMTSGAEIMTMPRFSVSGVHTGLHRGATVLLGTPMAYQLLGMADGVAGAGAGRLRALLSSGGPLSRDTRARAERALGLPIHQIYGSTEAGPIAFQCDREVPWPPESTGELHPSVRWRLEPTDSNGDPRTGRLHVDTSTLFSGYVGSSAAVTGADGMYDTGDLATVDPAGVLTVLGRQNRFVNVGGRKVDPGRVESVLLQHSNVLDASVFGRETRNEEAVHAAVVFRDPLLDVAEVVAHCRANLANYEVPYRIHVLPVLPRTPMGKIELSALVRTCAALPPETPPHRNAAPAPVGRHAINGCEPGTSTWPRRIRTVLAGAPDAALVLLGNFEVERSWGALEPGLPRTTGGSTSEIVHRMDEFCLLLAGAADHVVLKAAPDADFLDYLRSLSFELPRILIPRTAAPHRTVTEDALADPDLMRVLSGLAKSATFWPHGVGPREEELARLSGVQLGPPPARICKMVNSKAYSRGLASTLGLRQPRGWTCRTVAELRAAVEQADRLLAAGGAVVLKDSYGVSGKGMLVVSEREILARVAKKIVARTERGGPDRINMVLETWVAKSSDLNYQFTIGRSGEICFDFVREALTRNGVHKGHRIPAQLTPSQQSELREAGTRIGECLHRDGYFGVVGVDAMIDPESEVYPIVEINARNNMSTYQESVRDRYIPPDKSALATSYPVTLSRPLPFARLHEHLEELMFEPAAGSGLIVANYATVNAAAQRIRRDEHKTYAGRLYGIVVADTRRQVDELDHQIAQRVARLDDRRQP
ncbi:AMP-binding protein [Nocardia asteroides]|uniref:AMP-binding protein n=1 Tax=Nocardia asteroides TaxID=1824 RepID=UPI001E62056D|nr:AMP-binding protein [Nocardia asteroides]UGT61027.1 AMP-binding protein [Nocardia asteroides]